MSRRSDLLIEKEQLLKAIASERACVLQEMNNRSRRRKSAQTCIEMIRLHRLRLAQELTRLRRIRSMSDADGGNARKEIDKWDVRLVEVSREAAHLRAQKRVEYLARLAAEINEIEDLLELKPSTGDPAAVSISDIVS